MFPHVIEAVYIREYRVWLKFNDGTEGEVDLSTELTGEIFESLQDINVFSSFSLKGDTLSWENGADFAPEFLKQKIINKSAPAVRVNQYRQKGHRKL